MLFPNRRSPEITASVHALSTSGELERGAVFTRPEVVRAILDLVGYRSSAPLHLRRILEPSFGHGEFLLEIVDRLLSAFGAAGGTPATARAALAEAVRGVELHGASHQTTRAAVRSRLCAWGIAEADAESLLGAWLIQDDFLLTHLPGAFDAVVGNPPYVRQERIAAPLLAEYRRRYRTIYDRADLYVPFFERGLDLLGPSGTLGYICANRWMKNKFGGPLREKIARDFSLTSYIDLSECDAFHAEVMAYAAITIMQRGRPDGEVSTRVARRPPLAELPRVVASLTAATPSLARAPGVETIQGIANGSDPWLLDDAAQLRLLRDLERRFPTLEAAGCKVGIGVATGCDRVFIGRFDELPVEDERKLPLAMAADLKDGRVVWSGRGVINPFEPDGSLASFDKYPRFRAYVETHRDAVAGRHCAQKNPGGWYRTIDRIYPDLAHQPKLLIPDIKGDATVALDAQTYPHHNLYYVVSDSWDLRALRAVLSSSVALLFIASYCVRMGGGFLRFQAQYLRRICVPRWDGLRAEVRESLVLAGQGTDPLAMDRAVAAAYGLTAEDLVLVRSIAEDARVGSRGTTSEIVERAA